MSLLASILWLVGYLVLKRRLELMRDAEGG